MNAEVSKLVQGVTGHDYYPQRRLPERTEGIAIHLLPYFPIFVSPLTVTWLNMFIMTALMLGPRMKLFISELRKRMWWRVISEPGLFAQHCNSFSGEIHRRCHPVSSGCLCPHALTMRSNGAWQNNASEEKQEAEPAERVYRGSLHVAPVTRASKTRSVWCGFNEFHYHEILLCGCTAICVGVKTGVINRCAISRCVCISKVWILYVCF